VFLEYRLHARNTSCPAGFVTPTKMAVVTKHFLSAEKRLAGARRWASEAREKVASLCGVSPILHRIGFGVS